VSDIEKQLVDLKNSYQQISAPPELEHQLRTALEPTTILRPNRKWVAAVVIAFLLFGYSWDALAYYGKKLIGYEQVVTGSIEELLTQGKGQQIGKGAAFTNGIVVTLDSLIMDGKGFTTLVKYQYPVGYQKVAGDTIHLELKGILSYARGGGSGEIKGDTEYWVRSFDEEPMILEKRMELRAQRTANGRIETISIPFVLSRGQAYVPTVGVKKIGEVINTAFGTIIFDNVQASALNTVITGRIKNAEELVPNKTNRSLHLNFSLSNDDTALQRESSSISSQNDRDFAFEFKFAGLQELKQLKITDISFEEHLEIDKEIVLVPGMKAVELGNEPGIAVLEAVKKDGNNTIVIIRHPTNHEIIAGFFKGKKQIDPAIIKHEETNFTRLEYVLAEQNVTLAIKGIIRSYPVKKEIVIE